MTKIPEGWIETKLGNVSNIKGGKRLPKGESIISTKTNHPYIRITDMENNKIKDGVQFISDDVFSSISRYIVNTGDVILSIVGTIGLVAMINENLNNANLTENCVKFINLKNLENKFLYYFLISKSGQDEIIKNTVGAVQKKLPIYGIENINITLPPLPEQKAIAGVLSSFDDKIELLRAENQTLEEMGQTLFKEWFGKYKVGDELPDGWRVGRLGEVGNQITERVKNGANRVVLSAVNTGNLVLSEEYFSKQVFSEDIAKYIICNKGDFAYNPARINIGSIGRNFNWNGAVSPVYVVFRPGEKFGKFLEFVFKSERFKKHVEKYANGSVRQALNYDGFSRFELLIPNNDILEKFNENLETFEKKIEENKKQIETLSNTRDQLLPKLMSGEVRVEF